MKNIASLHTVVTAANAAELVVGIAREVLGNDVADVVQGNELNADAIRSVAITQIQSEFSNFVRGGN